ncbi:MAG TPA: hypothetical protein VHC22_29145 [Pirellulales bacterium]|nr:hypothetical protein [Pirellulales bacterium]
MNHNREIAHHDRAAPALVCRALAASRGLADETWVDISSTQIGQLAKQPRPGGCAGVVVDRLTGDVSVNIVGHGLWKAPTAVRVGSGSTAVS